MKFTQGNLFDVRVEALVNAVNTVGVMGKGIALMFKQRFPANFKAYETACKTGEVQVGKMFVTAEPDSEAPRWIINFPTKKHWRQPTELEWVKTGLDALKEVIREKGIRSIAIPALGCGNGGLDWAIVRPMIETALGDLQDVEVIVFEPAENFQNLSTKRTR